MKRNLLFFLSLWALCAFTTTAVAEEVDYTSSIVNADLSTTDAWNTEGTKGISGGVVKVGSGSSFDFSQTITIPAGHYKMTAKAAYRYGANEQEEYDAIQASANTHLAKLYAQTAAQTFEVNVFNRYEGASETDYAAGSGSVTVNGLFVPNSSDAVKAWFEAGQYVNVLEFDVLEDGEVKIGIVKTESAANGDYANIGAWTLTRTGDAQNTGDGEGDGEGDDTNTIDVDKTSLVGTSKAAWNAGGVSGAFEVGFGLPEKYETTTATLGDMLWQTVTGLDNGTYTVELYANARYTSGRGFDSPAADGAMDCTFLFANNVELSIPVVYNADCNNCLTFTLEGVEVTDGTLRMGMTKKAAGSNWHTIQIKSLTWHTSGDAALKDAKNALQALIDETKAVSPAIESLTEAIATAEAALAAATSVEEVEAAQTALQAAYDAAADQIAYNKNVASVAGASATNPIATNFVVNGTFDSNGVVSPWKTTTGAQNQTTATNQKGAFTGNFFENWNPGAYTGKIYQTINNIPNGVYELSICAFVEAYGNGTNQYVYANEAKTYLTTGAPTAYKVLVEVTNNTIEVGFEQSEAVNQWCGIDNVSLTYYGNCTINEARFASYIKQVKELRATATDLLAKVNEANKSALQDALDATETIGESVEEYVGAIEILTEANTAAKANAEVKAAIDNYYDLMASTNVYTQEAYDTFKAIADGYLAKWESNELTETVDNPYAIHGHRAANNYDDFLLSAWGTNNFDTDLYINTWSVEGENDGSNFKVPFFEYWTGDANSLPAATKSATVSNLLPNGTYKVSAWVRVRAKNGQTDPTGITLSVGAEGTPVDVTEGAPAGTAQMFLAEYTAVGVADAEGNLTISFNVAADNNISWLSFKNVKYEYVEPVAEFEVTLTNPAGETAEIMNEGEFITFTTNMDDKAGFILMDVYAYNDADETAEPEAVTVYRGATKGDSDWSVELYSNIKFREGFTYKFAFYAYESEDAYNQEPFDAPYSSAFATDVVEVKGTAKTYTYAEGTLVSITPGESDVIKNEADSIVTLVFSAPVAIKDAKATVREGGPMAPPTVYNFNTVAVDDDDADGFATTWQIAIKLFPGSAPLTFYAEDANGNRVQGNMGEEETSSFYYEWSCTVGIPGLIIAPEGEVEGPISTITVSSTVTIDIYFGNGAVYDAEGNVVAEFANMEKVVDPSLEMYTAEWYEALAATPVTITLSKELTEGTYTVKFEDYAFMLEDGRYMSSATEATFTVISSIADGINGITAGDVAETEYFNINGAALNTPVKGINVVKMTLKNGKVVTSKVYVK